MEQRTNQQNRALHKLYTDIATHCVAHGIDQKTVINQFEKFETPVTPEAVKETWRIIQSNMYPGKTSTTQLETHEVDKVYEVFALFWSRLTHEEFPFPSYESLANEHLDDNHT